MREALLHYIWQFQYFSIHNLSTSEGERIHIYHQGFRNQHAGPDFSNARIRIGEIEWIGNVEIHINSSGWLDHKHDKDPAYENVILHVVWKEDKPIGRIDQSKVPTLELHQRVDLSLMDRYNRLMLNPETIPCSASVSKINSITRISMMEKALLSRLESKSGQIYKILESNNNDWEETCYQLLCKNFGFKVNGDAFYNLALTLPYKFIMKHADNQLQIEALIFGQAGLLDEDHEDTYLKLLQREYKLLSNKFGIREKKLNKVQLRFLRLRPANFPTIRLAQLACLLFREQNIFSKFINIESYKDLFKLLKTTQSEYWLHHYLFNRYIEDKIPGLGKMSIDNIIINTVVPLMVAYGRSRDEQHVVDKAVMILQRTESENNIVIKGWRSLGFRSTSAFDSQGLLEMHNNYCLRRKCLDCTIGASLIRPSSP